MNVLTTLVVLLVCLSFTSSLTRKDDDLNLVSSSQVRVEVETSRFLIDNEVGNSQDTPMDPSEIRFPLYLRVSATTICVLLLMVGCPGNLLIPFVVLKTKELRNSTNIFLINLSVSDLLILLITSPTVLVELHSQPEVWFMGLFMCKAVSFIEMCVAHASILTMLAISFERFYAICRPLQAGYKCTKRRAFVIILIIWLIALLSTLPMISITQLTEEEYMDGSMVPVCSNSLQTGWHPVYYCVVFLLFFALPFVILLILYFLISRRLTSDSKSITTSTNFRRRTQVRRQVVFMLASVCVTFFVCLLPFRLLTLWIIVSDQEEIHSLGVDAYYILLFVCRLLLYVNSSVNPILYNLISSKFRSAFCRILKINFRQEQLASMPRESCTTEKFSTTIDRGERGQNGQTGKSFSNGSILHDQHPHQQLNASLSQSLLIYHHPDPCNKYPTIVVNGNPAVNSSNPIQPSKMNNNSLEMTEKEKTKVDIHSV